jgi:hypothetical protein
MNQPRAPISEKPTAAIERRIAELQNWFQENGADCFDEQAHLDDGSRERLYWHYGYLVALRDILALLPGERRPPH